MIIIIIFAECVLGKMILFGIHHINDEIKKEKTSYAYEVVTYNKTKKEDLILIKQIKGVV